MKFLSTFLKDSIFVRDNINYIYIVHQIEPDEILQAIFSTFMFVQNSRLSFFKSHINSE